MFLFTAAHQDPGLIEASFVLLASWFTDILIYKGPVKKETYITMFASLSRIYYGPFLGKQMCAWCDSNNRALSGRKSDS